MPGGCWAHYSALAIGDGYESATAGDVVTLEYEQAEQGGHGYRAVRFWPASTDPVEPTVSPPGAAYRSTLTTTFDDEGRAASVTVEPGRGAARRSAVRLNPRERRRRPAPRR
ncbi:hypothetical protein [Blastococcus sp. TF02A-26]|uniref:hypothetical protein n=1 Tax=Blastococcus sp. TF02A-26 TaxID=2250577 RepID=UPI000DE95347|nr:hypothetical protein [Blastococcus sp. TF02A-26]RBY80716.1 hypothetical protein DQ240_21395 [Blastococcus sp. TF02A-26]